MAKIILNVDLNLDTAKGSIETLKKSLSTIADSLNKVQPNKDLTEQVKALSEYYKSLATAAKSAVDADSKAAISAAKVTKAEQDAAKAAAQRQKAETDAAAALARRSAAEARAFDTIEKTKAAMEKRAKAAEEDGKALWNLEKAFASLSKRQEDAASKTNAMDQALRDVAEETEETWKEIRAFNENGEALSSTVDELRERYERLAAQTASYEKELNEQVKAEIEAEKEAQRLAESFQKSEENLDGLTLKLNNMLTAISNVEGRYPAGTFDQLKADIQAQIAVVEGLKESVSSSGGNVQEFIDKEQAADLATKELNGRFAELKAQTEHAAPAVATLGDKFGNLVERYAKFYASSLLVRKPLQLIQNALADVGETLVKTEDAVIELNRVLDDPQPTQEVANRLYDIAYQYGSTFENASTIAANFARAGKSWNESLQATEAALLAMNVAELNATEASDGLLSIIAQFDMETSDLIDVVDKLNKTADKNPVSTQKLLQAIQRAGSAAKNANVSFDQTLGLITAISEATNRSGQNIGTAVNSLIQYSTKNVDVFATLSKESEEMVEKFKLGLVSIVDVWNQVAKDIHDDKEARDNIITALGTDDLEELSSTLHDELGDLVSEIDNTYNVANTYRKNYFIALLDNMDRYMKVQEQLTDYQGYSQEENEKYMETYTAKVNQLNDAWQKLANDEQGILKFKKDLVEIGIIATDFVDQSGGIVETLKDVGALVGGLTLVAKAEKLTTTISTLGTTIVSVLSGASGALATGLGWIGLIGAAISAVTIGVNAYRGAQERAREESVAAWESDKERAITLEGLIHKYETLTPGTQEYYDVEKALAELLDGDKQVALQDSIQGTEEYTNKVKDLVGALKLQLEYEAQIAKRDAEKSFVESVKNVARDKYGEIIIGMDSDEATAYLRRIQNEARDVLADYEEALVRVSEASNERELNKALNEADKLKSLYDEYSDIIKDLTGEYNKYKGTLETVEEYETAKRMEAIGVSYEEVRAIGDLTEQISIYEQKAQELGISLRELWLEHKDIVEELKASQEATEEAGEAAEEASAKYDKAAMGADAFAEKLSEDTAALKADADAISAVRAAQEEFNESGGLSIETISKLASLGSDWVDVLFDENGAVDVNSNAIYYLLAAKNELLTQNGVLIDSTEEETAAIEKVTEQLKDYSAQIDDVQNALSVLETVQAEYDETGSLSIDTLQKLLELGGEYLDLIIDEEGQIRLNQGAVDDLVESKKTLLEKLIDEQTVQYAVTLVNEKMAESEESVGSQAEAAAKRVAVMVAQVRELAGDSEGAALALEGLKTALAQIGGASGVSLSDADLDEIAGKTLNYNQSLRNLLASSVNTSSSGWRSSSGSSSSSSSKSTKDEYLEDLKAVVSLRESELTLMEHQGASQDEQIAKIHQIQEAIHTEADYLRSIGASQEDINKLSSDWWKWQEKIVSMQEKSAEAAKKAAEEAKKAAEEAEKAETARLKQVLADDKARLTLMEKQGKSVSERVEKMKDIQAHLHDEAEWLRKIGAEQSEIDALSAEWWDWQEKILKLYKETLDAARDLELEAQQKIIDGILNEIKLEKEALEISEKRLAVDEKRADLEDAIAQAKIDYVQSVLSDYITALSDAETLEQKQRAVAEAREKLVQAEREAQAKSIIDTFKAEKDVKNDTLSLEEKRLAVEKARQALIDAENNRTTRVFNEATGQWEYQADAKAVQSAKDNLKSAVDALNAYVEEQAWNEVAEAVENGSVSEAEVLEILSKWAKEAYGNGSPEFVAKIQSAFRKAMGSAASPDTVAGQISAVDSAVKSLNDYLKSEAVKELKSYIAAGNTDAAGMKSILDKWLSMGEGGELYEWRNGLLDSVNGAIESGYYDDSKVQSQIQAVEKAVESLHDYLRSRFISEITDLVKNGTAEEIRGAIEKWSNEFDLSETDRDWASRLADAKGNYEQTENFWNGITAKDHTAEEIAAVLAKMKANSQAWWMATPGSKEQQDLADMNLALGSSMGWTRKADGHWYDTSGNQVYDRGGILTGQGGIKATSRAEAVLDPKLTAKLMNPTTNEQFERFAKSLHLMFETGERTARSSYMTTRGNTVDSHNTSYTVNGIPISSGSAERYTIAELFRMLPMARS